MADNSQFDLIVIGTGPGGYTAAIRGAQLGLKTAVVEKRETFGGTCLNVGCIPAKALLDTTELYDSIKFGAADHGIIVKDPRFDLGKIMERKRETVERFTKGVALLLRENRVATFRGTGTIPEPGRVNLTDGEDSGEELAAKNILIATGSVPVEISHLPFDGKHIINSDQAMSLEEVPGSLLVVGAGAIGLEMGSIWFRLGSEVTVIELMKQIIPEGDAQVSRSLMQLMKKKGMAFSLSTEITEFSKKGGKIKLSGKNDKGEDVSFSGDRVLVAAGRRPFFEGLGMEDLGVEMTDKKRIKVNDRLETSVKGIFAIGDVIEGPMLAHKAGDEGIAVAETIAGKSGHVNYDTIPNVVYTWPEVASVGRTEEYLKEQSIPYKKGTFNFRINGRGVTSGNVDGFVKILSHEETDRVLGAHILGPWASDLISEIVTVMEFSGSSEDIARIVHAHPTLSEAVKEAAMDVEDRAIHTPPKKGSRQA